MFSLDDFFKPTREITVPITEFRKIMAGDNFSLRINLLRQFSDKAVVKITPDKKNGEDAARWQIIES